MSVIDPPSIGIGIGISILANLLTVPLQKILTTSFSIPRRIKSLRQELLQVKNFYNERSGFYLKTISSAFIAILFIGIGNAFWVLTEPIDFLYFIDKLPETLYQPTRLILLVSGLLSFMISIWTAISYLRLLSKVIHFDRYKVLVNTKIEDLEKNQRQSSM